MSAHRSRSGIAYDPLTTAAVPRLSEHERMVRYQEIIALRFDRYWTYAEIAGKFGVTRQRVDQIIAQERERRCGGAERTP